MSTFKNFISEKVKITSKKTDKIINKIEEIVGKGYDVEVEFYGDEGVDPLFSVEPIPSNDIVEDISNMLKKQFKNNIVKNNIVKPTTFSGYVLFAIK